MPDVVRSVVVRVEGRVQGVGYRVWTQRTAVALGLRGWVRNRRDGSVEAALFGPPASVEEMIGRCHDGPPGAAVLRVEVDDDPQGQRDLVGFEVRPTV